MTGLPPGRYGVFGGTFDPVHLGHLIAAEHAREALGLARVWLVPARRSPLKPGGAAAAADHRAAMLERAIAGHPAFALHRADLDRADPSYTVDTLALLRAELDGRGDSRGTLDQRSRPVADDAGQRELIFVLGADAARDLPRWRDPAGIASLARLAVLSRPSHAIDVGALERAVPAVRGRVDVLDERQIAISATEIRQCVAEGRSIRYLVPDAVRAYIEEHGLYRLEDAHGVA